MQRTDVRFGPKADMERWYRKNLNFNGRPPMLTLYSYPTLFGVADNNGYGLKVFAFLKLAGVPFRHEHIFDASKAPRSQLPYIIDGDDIVGDSETILAYVTQKYRLTLDAALTPAQLTTNLLITRKKTNATGMRFATHCCANIQA